MEVASLLAVQQRSAAVHRSRLSPSRPSASRYTNPAQVVEYSDGEVRQQFSICFHAEYVSGEPATSDESSEARWVAQQSWRRSTSSLRCGSRIHHGLKRREKPYIG
jgi:hypothetical protein